MFVTVKKIPRRCKHCRRPIGLFTFRVVPEDDLLTRAFLEASGGTSTEFRTLGWHCSTCAADLARCGLCGHRLAGFTGWLLDDDSLVTCHPFAPMPPEGVSCFNEGCAGYHPAAFAAFLDRRCRVLRAGTFPDPYQRLPATVKEARW